MEPEFIKVDAKADEELLIQKYQELTETKVFPAQDTRLLIAVMAYYAALIKSKVNDACKLNLVKTSRYPILDFLGAMKNCKRLEYETDDAYIERILLAPEGFSVAGPELAYIYFAKSADPFIVDVEAEVPSDDIVVNVDDTTVIMETENAINEAFNTVCNYQEGEVEITLNEALEAGSVINVKVPHPYRTNLYILTKTGIADEEILNKVSEALKPVKPLCDVPLCKSAEIVEFSINGIVYLKKNTDKDTVEAAVNDALNAYLNGINMHLKKSVVKNQIRGKVMSVNGVHDFKLTNPRSYMPVCPGVAYVGSIGNITYERTDNE